MGKISGWLVFWVLGASMSWGAAAMNVGDQQQKLIHEQCGITRYPKLCVQTLLGLGHHHQHVDDVVSALVNKTISETRLPTTSNFAKHSYLPENQDAQLSRAVTDYCGELMSMSLRRLDQSLLALKKSPRKNKHDIQTWLSAAMTFQQSCKDSADNLNSGEVTNYISDKMDTLSQLSSNTLSLVNRISGKPAKDTVTDFPTWVSGRERKLLQAGGGGGGVKANAVVAKDGSGNFQTVAAAIAAASGNRFVIYVKAGVYKEKIKCNKDGITLIGEGKYSTIIVNDDSVNGGVSMPATATFTITGDGFIARDIGFQNTAGPGGEQALALYVSSDHSVVYRCSIAGYQDTLYALALRQFYRECDIYGTVDFIFGNAAAIFQNCNLELRRPRGDYNVILANGRTDPGQNTGFSLQNCRISVSSDYAPIKHSHVSYLGRPWKQYSRAVVMESNIDDAIAGRGWVEWPGAGSSTLESLYFAEYSNGGPGSGVSNRVQWPGFHVIGATEAVKFTVANFIGGTSWLPSTGVTFTSGL